MSPQSGKKIRSFQSMRLTMRFIIPLIIAMTLLAYALLPLVDKLTLHWFTRDLDMRSQLIANTIQEPLGEFLEQGNAYRINSLMKRALQDERLFAMGFCDGQGKLLYSTPKFPEDIACPSPDSPAPEKPSILKLPSGLVHIAVKPFLVDGVPFGYLFLIHDMSFIESRSADTRKYVVFFFVILFLVISFITVLVAHLSWRGWMSGVRALLRGEGLVKPFAKESSSELQPLMGDLRALLRTIDVERRLADDVTISWNPDKLRELLYKQLAGEQILVVSNREPYIHMKGKEVIEVNRPASGLVTAIEPVMKACSGTWIAHGGGTADREVVDKNDHVYIPPENPKYTLRRIWLSREEEKDIIMDLPMRDYGHFAILPMFVRSFEQAIGNII